MAIESERSSPQRVAFLLDNLNGGGAERVVLGTAAGFAALGYDVDLLVFELRGELCDSVPDEVNLVVLPAVSKVAGLLWAVRLAGREGLGGILHWLASAGKLPRSFRSIPGIIEYLRARRPAVIASFLGKSGISMVLASRAEGVDTRMFVGIQNALSRRSEQARISGKGQADSMERMFRYCFPRADGVIASSGGVAEDAIQLLGLDATRVHVVYNPVVVEESNEDAVARPEHPWFMPGAPPVILGIGRLVEQKNFPLLIRAFAAVRGQLVARLVILGGDESSNDQATHRQELLALATELGVGDDFALPGFQSNPHIYLRAASVFVLSSLFEGFGNVLVEALLAGCPVVSTDCPSGPAEILGDGQYGALVPVGDVQAMSSAILSSLATQPDRDQLRARGREFSMERAVAGYHRVFFGVDPPGEAPSPGT